MSNPTTASRFDEIYDSTRKDVLAFITARCGCTADISDVFQETYMELYKLLVNRGADYVTHEKALVMRIAKRKIAKQYTLLARLKNFVSLTTVNEDGEEVNLAEFEADDFSTEDFSVNNIMLENARQLIRSKPTDVRKVFYLMYDVGLTIPEIAQALSMSESNVKNKLYRTLKEIRNLLS
ncbi:MAG: RNA polymerase sigma factor [Defluviitaleaceae bacterium]|nr:RNA polymerase sigma factor [Defluviitaleaceae bacterium]MCL2238545.1 RNA polymerase sigma factor [Defluviitaleaceae bacterium]